MLDLILEYRVEAQSYLAWLVCIAALIWGGGPEKLVAAVWLFFFKGLDSLYHLVSDQTYRLSDIDLFHTAMDFSAAVAFIWIALNANRMYPLWIASFQLVSVTAHLARDMAEAVTPIAYAVMALAPSYFQLFIFAGGLALHLRRNRLHGEYRDWRWPTPPDHDQRNLAARYLGI